ncbi:Retrovirus-related Pol polyprotein from transposon RE1 [Vitis vinifera]|uniref:Retrovirus-related Pol polyprotein from transposon RE1 n=1 Tax=Vitis vinifera TaxID=29760 RepID=A0A438G2Q7_VITVI|nr:Retrovirus-related Pol polyprotein from transposon RE1 [Vitis vinifera]
MGQFHHFLGIEVIRQSTGLHLTQTKYIEDLLTKTRMIGATPIAISCFTSFQLSQYDGTLLENATMYRSTVGALQYLTISRPEIAFVISKVNQFIHKSTDLHWKASKRLLRYLKGTMHYGLFITLASQLDLVAYSDVDWASNPDDRKSTSGCCIYLGSSLVSWGA